ncbi:aminopeptidase [Chitinophaga oryzae]|uniref:Aminopeptidase n=1 Tax=Chitinophaga oryzae TaxID=2725414 RepID=A0ABX6LN76_9BACT|nr:M1 family metallopeptidase [Chitinophaga oryzae]QJB41579.1 aminopeptidase [Chitinophaga oryzae]
MNAVFLFDVRQSFKSGLSCAGAALLLLTGVFAGYNFHLYAGEGVGPNAPYSIGFILGILSLSVIFIATVCASTLLFREWDNRFDALLFSTPLSKGRYISGRLLALYAVTAAGFLWMTIGFAAGQHLRTGATVSYYYYGYAYIIFGAINSLFVCSVLFFLAWQTKNKLMMALGGLLLYVLYMVTLLFSDAPFMAQASPQPLSAQQLSALTDPFGLSAYFYRSRDFMVIQRKTLLVPLSGYFLVNRLGTVALSLLLITIGYKRFSYTLRQTPKASIAPPADKLSTAVYTPAITGNDLRTRAHAVWSFTLMDIRQTLKSIPFAASVLLLLFYMGMELYGTIESGIRLPQQYASSGLLAGAILKNFHLAGVLLLVYFVHELYWKSSMVRLTALENTTIHRAAKLWGHWCSCLLLLSGYTGILILQAILFQVAYGYPHIDLAAYGGIILFNTCPLLLLAAMLLLFHQWARHHYVASGLCMLTALITASPLSRYVLTTPLLRFFTGHSGPYSDFTGYGSYTFFFTQRLLFGTGVVALLWLIKDKPKGKRWGLYIMLPGIGAFSAIHLMTAYHPRDDRAQHAAAARYEKQYRHYRSVPQPVVTAVTTNIQLYPAQQRYTIAGRYVIKNKSGVPVDKVLLNFDETLDIVQADYISARDSIRILPHVSELTLKHPLAPDDSATIHFELSYHWSAVNGHQSFNAIIGNGSFMRISRYYPQIGYQADRELTDTLLRQQYALGAATAVPKLEDTVRAPQDFVRLDMVISTDSAQTAIGTGELTSQWRAGDRNYFRYQPGVPVPFRFAVSSAGYRIQRERHNGVEIRVCYHPRHAENVVRLISDARQALDYCRQNFGPYPFRSITFAEISSFTRGFAGTAYPGVIFMAEDMVFRANIGADGQQDAVHEITAHELSHQWWGNSQIDPDYREGAVLLTETLAMYTEMMLYKKKYGKQKMQERLKIHQQIYEAEKGLTVNQPLYKVSGQNTHIAYSKGAMVMVALTDLIGEDKVNLALQHFLQQHHYPLPKPVSTDLIQAFLAVSEARHHAQIKKMFMEI